MDSRSLVLLLFVVLAGAGCVGAASDSPLEATSAEGDGAAAPEQEPMEDSAAQGSNVSDEGSSSTTAPPPPPPTRESPPEPPKEEPAPQPRPWSMWGAVRLGFVHAVGAGGAEDTTPVGGAAPAETDAGHCSNATFMVPVGASSLTFNISGEEVSPDDAAVGTFAVVFTSPAGKASSFEPSTNPPGDTDNRNGTFAFPETGDWRVEVKPIGPAVSQVWEVDFIIDGESVGAIPIFTAASGCS